ncbi:hypothetical protein J2Z49_001125 [Desulfofundulus luciae]|uniref:Uncharacterized protein n=1 Tax=Desulfofundulus luciae TaxID=74702 RepID=A0ABU0AZX9_9FIRM|nr:hypothetical protein [Desulfofundulus luciae]
MTGRGSCNCPAGRKNAKSRYIRVLQLHWGSAHHHLCLILTRHESLIPHLRRPNFAMPRESLHRISGPSKSTYRSWP